jgi:hypothetical protein
VYKDGFLAQWTNNITLENFTALSDHNRGGMVYGVGFTRRLARNLTVRGADIQGAATGIDTPNLADEYIGFGVGGGRPMVIENSTLRNRINLRIATPYAPDTDLNTNGGPEDVPPREVIVRNTRFIPYNYLIRPESSSNPYYAISTFANLEGGFKRANLRVSDTVKVYDYNGTPGNNFQVYYKEQAPTFIMPQTHRQLYASPEAGLTNQQNWNKYGIAIAGVITPCLNTRPEIQGFVCSLSGVPRDTTPPVAPSDLKVAVQ